MEKCNLLKLIMKDYISRIGNDSGMHKVVSALLRFDGLQWREVKLPILFYLQVNSFYLNNEGNVWMSAEGGLLKCSYTKPLKVFDPDTNGFFSKQCTSFIIDLNGDGWLTTLGGGIAKLKKGTF